MTYDPQLVAKACLEHVLQDMARLDDNDVMDICETVSITVPADDDDVGWSTVGATIISLIDEVRKHTDLPEDGGLS